MPCQVTDDLDVRRKGGNAPRPRVNAPTRHMCSVLVDNVEESMIAASEGAAGLIGMNEVMAACTSRMSSPPACCYKISLSLSLAYFPWAQAGADDALLKAYNLHLFSHCLRLHPETRTLEATFLVSTDRARLHLTRSISCCLLG